MLFLHTLTHHLLQNLYLLRQLLDPYSLPRIPHHLLYHLHQTHKNRSSQPQQD